MMFYSKDMVNSIEILKNLLQCNIVSFFVYFDISFTLIKTFKFTLWYKQNIFTVPFDSLIVLNNILLEK